ncbi:MAG: response regulator transcription factor [Bacteroidales bacterium]|nr:response regulator transcription factor [Bacteroidales bacterium]
MAIKIFIADDHYMVVEGIRSMLLQEKNIEWMGHAMNAASCMAFLHQQQPDVLLLDINMPDKSGIDLCKEIKEKYPEILIIGLSSFNQQSYIQKMMQNGASGYVLKNASREEIVSAIESVINGDTFLSSEASVTMRENKDAQIPVITRREKEVLQLIAEGLINKEIAEKLFISTTTVDTHRNSLLSKFDVKNTANLIKLAAQYNLI